MNLFHKQNTTLYTSLLTFNSNLYFVENTLIPPVNKKETMFQSQHREKDKYPELNNHISCIQLQLMFL